MNDRTQSINDLLAIMQALRDPEKGCPWDRAQRFETILPYTLEEAYEVAEAIESGDRGWLREELGDLLFQVVFYAQMADEEGAFDFHDVAKGIAEKMRRRHPHVFGDETIKSVNDQSDRWEEIKRAEKSSDQAEGQLTSVNRALPALMRAEKLQKRAARVGFDWPEVEGVLDKVREELDELCGALKGDDAESVTEELGDLLFSCVNLSRFAEVSPEVALRRANSKFECRFGYIEKRLAAQGRSLQEASLTEMDALWEESKSAT